MRAWPFLLVLCACPEQVGIIAQDPSATAGNDQGEAPTTDKDRQRPQTNALEADEKTIEPDHPAVKSPQERALVHIHTPVDICSGILIAPKLVATAHQCFSPDLKGTYTVQEKERESYRVEVASSTLTWTIRRVASVITPSCDWKGLDLAIVVLDEAAPSPPVSVGTVPSAGATVQALGFGKCRGDTKAFSNRTGAVVARGDSEVVVDILLCQGDVGGAVFDTGSSTYVGVISQKSDRRHPNVVAATSIVRFDTQRSRDLLAAAEAATKGQSIQNAIACE